MRRSCAGSTEISLIWGTGTPRREFLYADDCADALVSTSTKTYSGDEPCECGLGRGPDVTTPRACRDREAEVIGFTKAEIVHDTVASRTGRRAS
jgi:GDP-L-fucose synthase